jgi:hypothetical protein
MDNNKGLAVVLPNSTPSAYEVQQDIQAQAERRRQQQIIQQQREQARQQGLMQYMGNTLDPKDYDQLLQTKIQGLHGKYAQMIQKNPGMTMPELQQLMAKDLTGMSQWNTALKIGQDTVQKQGEAYKEYKGIDVANAQRAALNKMLFETDENGKLKTENGQPVLRDPNTIDFNKNYINDELYSRPDLYLSQKPNINNLLSKIPASEQNVKEEYRAYGPGKPTVTNEYNAKIFPWQQIVTDPKTGKKDIKTKYEPLMVNGREAGRMIDENNMRYYTDDPQFRMDLQTRFPKWAQENGFADKSGHPIVPFNSPEGEKLQRMMIYQDLEDVSPKKMEPVHKDVAPQYPVSLILKDQRGKDDKATFTPEDIIMQTVTGKGDFGSPDIDGRTELIDEIGKGYKIRVPGVDHLVNATSIKFDKQHPENGIQIDGSYQGYDKQTHFLERPVDVPLESLSGFVKQAARVNTSGRNYIKSEKKVDAYQGAVEQAKQNAGSDNYTSRWKQMFPWLYKKS